MELYENVVLQYLQEEDKRIRIVAIDNRYCYIVNLGEDTSMPKIMYTDEINELFNDEKVVIIKEPYPQFVFEEEISVKNKLVRDEDWNIVEYLWYEKKSEFLDKRFRSKTILEASTKYNKSTKKVRRVISRFLQRGMKKNSLLPDYDNSGGKGKRKASNGKKRGRSRAPEKDGKIIEGINIDDTSLNIISMSIKLFYLKKDKKSVAESYRFMLKKFYSDKKIIDNEQKSFVWDKSRIPTYRQFLYWYNILEDKKTSIIMRNSQKDFDLHKRDLLSNSTIDTWGPGSRYQIDATVADVYLVSALDRRRVIGRPVVYGVIDVFSRLFCGIYVGLEGPSWLGAMMALDNVIEDKVDFCSQYGINIKSEKWPNSYLPEKILADRGEFEGYNVENLINNLNIKIENTAPYRGDLKGIVERNFRTINERIKHMTPGAIAKQFRERGDRDYRLDAVLNIEEFTAIIIHEVINHNNSLIASYPMSKEMILEEVIPVPNDIWNWGMGNRRCAFKYIEKDIVRLNLMYKKKTTITREGIKFNSKMFYGCDIAIKEEWYLKKVNKKLDIVYDPRNMDFIYIPLEKGSDFIKCTLLDKSCKYKGLSLEEVVFLHELENENKSDYKNSQNQVDIDYIESASRIIEKAKSKTMFSKNDSEKQIIKNIKKYRLEEKEKIRDIQKFELNKETNKDSFEENCVSTNYQNIRESESSSKMNLFKKVRGEKVGE